MAQRQQGIQRVEWDYCDRCGFLYPIEQLIAQRGLRVCSTTCFDQTLVEERDMMIAQVLEDDSELLDDERLIQDDGDLRFIW
jgi:hypothetical protein